MRKPVGRQGMILLPLLLTAAAPPKDVDAVLALTAANGSKVVYPGEHKLIFSTGVPAVPDVVQTIVVQ